MLGCPTLEFIGPVSPSITEEPLERFSAGAAPPLQGLPRAGRAEKFTPDADLVAALEAARSPAERRQLFDKLTKSSDPEVVVETAFREYDRTGREAFLLHGVSVLEAFGKQAWPALLRVAESGRTETELFLGLIARCPEVSDKERSNAFYLVAKHAPPPVRQGMLEHLVVLGPARELDILHDLAGSDPDPGIKAEAAERLAALAGSDE